MFKKVTTHCPPVREIIIKLPPALTLIVFVLQVAVAPLIVGLNGVPPGITTSEGHRANSFIPLAGTNQLLSIVYPTHVPASIAGTVTVTEVQVVLQLLVSHNRLGKMD